MKFQSKLIHISILFLSLNSFGQAVLDPSLLSQLSPEQLAIVKSAYEGKNSTDIDIEDIPVIDESLVNISNSMDANKISGQKYGYDFFSTMPTSLTAVGDLPLPNDYKISLRDQFKIILSGSKDAIFNLNVKLDGTILFPELGSVPVVGLTFIEVKNKLAMMVEQSYIGVNIDVSLQNLSAKKITIVGAVKTPGTYLVNPFSTITSALAYSGGISDIGSLRNIKLIRNKNEIYSFDLYDLLIKGDRSNDLTIEAGDTILISPAMQFVEISGAVKRPAVYEILENENLGNLIDFSLGFQQVANKTNISVSFLDLDKGLISKKTLSNLKQNLNNVLSVNVFSYVSQEASSIQVMGAIEEPGFYDLKKYNLLSDLIKDLNFVDVYPWLAVVEQFDENNLVKSSMLFSLNDPSTYEKIKLLPNSKVIFTNINTRSFNLSPITMKMISDYQLTVYHKESSYAFPIIGKYKVISFIDLLGLDMTDIDPEATYISPLESIVLNNDYRKMEFVAKKYNAVSFRSPINNLITVSISGAVDYPGTYIMKSNSKLEDLYGLIGDFKNEAYLEGIIFTRASVRDRQISSIEKSKADLNEAILSRVQQGENIGDINLIMALSQNIEPENLGRIAGDFSPSSKSSIETTLFDGDQIIVPKNPNVINVMGEVLNPIAFEYNKGLSVREAISNAGGYKQFARKNSTYVIKANGLIEKVNRNIFTRNVVLEPGDTIVVPRKIFTTNPGIDALLPITQVLSDLAFSAAALETLSNNN